MEPNKKTIEEVMYGKDIYQMLAVDFPEDLQEGRITEIDITKLPDDTVQNYKLGIALEALEEKDYKTAQAFYSQLGGQYEEMRLYAEKSWIEDREDRARENSKPKALTQRIISIKRPRARMEYAQKRITEIAERNQHTKLAIEGKLSLTDLAESYEKELEQMRTKLKKKEFEMALPAYFGKLNELECTLNEFQVEQNPIIKVLKAPLSVRKGSKLEKIGNGLNRFSNITAFGGLLFGAVSATFGFAPGVAIGLGMFGSYLPQSFVATVMLVQGARKNYYKKQTKDIFNSLKSGCEEVDKIIYSSFVLNHYLANPKAFKKGFINLGEKGKMFVIGRLIKQKEKNQELDSWISDNYAKLVEDTGLLSLLN